MTTESKWIKGARERGHRDQRNGVPYSHCPYLDASDEGRAWKNAWLAEHAITRPRRRKSRSITINRPVDGACG